MKINENLQVGETGKTIKSLFKQYILFENSNGQTGDINLSDNIANYDIVEIVYGCDGYYYSVKIEEPQDKKIGLMTHYVSENNNALYLYTTSYKFSNNQLKYLIGGNFGIDNQSQPFNFGFYSYVRIYKIIAYKS